MKRLSILIAAYNQTEFIRQNLDEVAKYTGDDVELVVSDDCSTEDLQAVVDSYGRDDFRYVRTPGNQGHDKNILWGLSKCTGEYVFLFRSKDIIRSEHIDDIVALLNRHPKASYVLFSAADENGKAKLTLEDRCYQRGREAVEAHDKLLIHPSGQIYRRDCLRLDLYRSYLDKWFDNIYGFTVHQLIRMDLTQQGDFVTSSLVAWMYKNTLADNTVAMNSAKKKINVYAPVYTIPRFQCEFDFAYREVKSPYNLQLCKQAIRRYFYFCTVMWRIINSDKEYNRHYNSIPQNFNLKEECAVFYGAAMNMVAEINNEDKINMEAYLKKCRRKTLLVDVPQKYLADFVRNNLKIFPPLYKTCRILKRKIIKS